MTVGISGRSGAILVGGASRRLGRNKAEEGIDGRTLLDRVLAVAKEVAEEVFLVAKEGAIPRVFGIRVVTEGDRERSALAGMVRAHEEAGERPLLVLACDHPFLQAGLLDFLFHRLEEAEGAAAVVPLTGGRLQPLVAVYRPARCLPVLRERLATGRRSLSEALSDLPIETVGEEELRREDPDLRSFLNVNDDADLARARSLCGKNWTSRSGRE